MDIQEYIAKQVQVVLKDYLDHLETTMYVYGTRNPWYPGYLRYMLFKAGYQAFKQVLVWVYLYLYINIFLYNGGRVELI